MKVWRIKSRHIALFYFSFVFFIGFSCTSSVRGETVINEKYLFSFKTHRSACMAKVNDFPIINNLNYASGTISTGSNITAFMENGKNTIELMMGSIDPNDKNTLYTDSTCELTITKYLRLIPLHFC